MIHTWINVLRIIINNKPLIAILNTVLTPKHWLHRSLSQITENTFTQQRTSRPFLSCRQNKNRLLLISKKPLLKTLFFPQLFSFLLCLPPSLGDIEIFSLAYQPHQGWKPGKFDFHHWSPDPLQHIPSLQTHRPGIHTRGSRCGTVQWPSLLHGSDCWRSSGLWGQMTELSWMVLNSYCSHCSESGPLRPSTMNSKPKFKNGNKTWILIYLYLTVPFTKIDKLRGSNHPFIFI